LSRQVEHNQAKSAGAKKDFGGAGQTSAAVLWVNVDDNK